MARARLWFSSGLSKNSYPKKSFDVGKYFPSELNKPTLFDHERNIGLRNLKALLGGEEVDHERLVEVARVVCVVCVVD